ncbi:MAG: CbtB-domain containing protein [Chlorobi bacterium]|nr:CbtB-domain containing protein [Chlorobiota bacterium]
MHNETGTISASPTISKSLSARVVPALLAASLGLALIFIAGFANSQVLHNAAHDGRHSAAFPCH